MGKRSNKGQQTGDANSRGSFRSDLGETLLKREAHCVVMRHTSVRGGLFRATAVPGEQEVLVPDRLV